MPGNQSHEAENAARRYEAPLLPIPKRRNGSGYALGEKGLSQPGALSGLAHQHLFRGSNASCACLGFHKRLTQIRDRFASIVFDCLGNLFNIYVTHFKPPC